MLGALAGDVIGSVFEHRDHRSVEFPLFVPGSTFTDDSVLTVATAEALLNRRSYAGVYQKWGRQYPNAGYGGTFAMWIFSPDPQPYNSWGNGSAMRVSPVGWAVDGVEAVEAEAARSAEVTHNHAEGIKGAHAVAVAVYLARTGVDKAELRRVITERYGYDLDRTVDDIRPTYRFDVSCQGSVPEAVVAFLDSNDFEDAVRKAISLGGDSDTIACIAGAVAEAHYGGVPDSIIREVRARLTPPMLDVIDRFYARYLGT